MTDPVGKEEKSVEDKSKKEVKTCGKPFHGRTKILMQLTRRLHNQNLDRTLEIIDGDVKDKGVVETEEKDTHVLGLNLEFNQ